MSLFVLVYVSSARHRLERPALNAILDTARRNNPALGVTGMLLYRDGGFMQALEGEEAVVRDLYARIARDRRHQGLITILAEPAERREFADWSMGFENLDPSRAAGDEAERVFFSLDRQSAAARGVAYRLLAGFRDRALA